MAHISHGSARRCDADHNADIAAILDQILPAVAARTL